MTSSEKESNVRMERIFELKETENVILYNLSGLIESISFSSNLSSYNSFEHDVESAAVLC